MVITEDVLKQIVWRINLVPELSGCIVGFYGNMTCRTIGFPSCVTPNSENIAVIVEEVAVSNGPTNAKGPAPQAVTHTEAQQIVKTDPDSDRS
jgi:hypothetical protein